MYTYLVRLFLIFFFFFPYSNTVIWFSQKFHYHNNIHVYMCAGGGEAKGCRVVQLPPRVNSILYIYQVSELLIACSILLAKTRMCVGSEIRNKQTLQFLASIIRRRRRRRTMPSDDMPFVDSLNYIYIYMLTLGYWHMIFDAACSRKFSQSQESFVCTYNVLCEQYSV